MSTEPTVERFRKRPIEVDTMLWDGTPERATEIQAWVGHRTGRRRFEPFKSATPGELIHHAELWVEHQRCLVKVPIGHRIVREADGNGFYPISPQAIAETYEPVDQEQTHAKEWRLGIPGESMPTDPAEVIAWFMHWSYCRRANCQCADAPSEDDRDHGRRAAEALVALGRLLPQEGR